MSSQGREYRGKSRHSENINEKKKVKLKLTQNNEENVQRNKIKDSKYCLRFPVTNLVLDTI